MAYTKVLTDGDNSIYSATDVHLELDAIQRELVGLKTAPKNHGVVTGLSVVEQASPDMTVKVNVGIGKVAGLIWEKTATTNVTITAADANNPRWDLVYMDSAGTLDRVTGTAAVNPILPALSAPTTQIPLAYVYVAAGDTAIQNAEIYDQRSYCTVSNGDVVYEVNGHTNFTSAGAGAVAIKTITIPANSFKRSDSLVCEFFLITTGRDYSVKFNQSSTDVLTINSPNQSSSEPHVVRIRMMANQTAAGATGSYKSYASMYSPHPPGAFEVQSKNAYSTTEIQMQATFNIVVYVTFTGASQVTTISEIKVYRAGYLSS